MTREKVKILFVLHILLMIYSFAGICSKLASGEDFLSLKFCMYYAGLIAFLGIYAIGWQQIIKKLPLTTAFANKAVTVVWGIIWGITLFHETVSVGKIIGAVFVIAGVILFAFSGEDTRVEQG